LGRIGESFPRFVRSIERTETVVTLDRDILPYRVVDAGTLVGLLVSRFRLKLKSPEGLAEVMQQRGAEQARLGTEGVVKFLLSQEPVMLVFEDGRFPLEGGNFVAINSLVFATEHILANVSGHTAIGEVLVAEAFEALWEAAGGIKRWESRDVQDRIQLKSFGTVTKVDLGFNPLRLLAGDALAYFNQTIVEGPERLGAAMVARSAYDNFAAPSDVACTLTLDELHLKVSVFDTRTGRQETARVRFSVASKDEQGRGIIDIVTELPLDKHVQFVQGLIEHIGKADARDRQRA